MYLNCSKQTKSFLPSFLPNLSGLSVTSSVMGTYTRVYVYGSTFFPNGTTFIQFGNTGAYLPVTYYSSFNISFVIPIQLPKGKYNVNVINLYNGNFSPQINQTYTGNINISKDTIEYTIT